MIAFETDVRINHPIEEVFAYVSDPLNASSRSWRAKRPREFAIRTTAGPTPFLYRYRFSAEKGETSLKLDAEVELRVPLHSCGRLLGGWSKRASMKTSRP